MFNFAHKMRQTQLPLSTFTPFQLSRHFEKGILGSSALMYPDDLVVYMIRACGYTIPSCSTPGDGLDGLTAPVDDSVFGGISLTNDEFQTYRFLLPLPHVIGPIVSTLARLACRCTTSTK